MKKYKPFSQQLRDCTEDGTLFKVGIPGETMKALACAKYKTTCCSKVCLADRKPCNTQMHVDAPAKTIRVPNHKCVGAIYCIHCMRPMEHQ